MKILRLDHVQIAIPPGGETEARNFYGGVLRMREIRKPEALAARGGCWFDGGDVQVHLGVDSDFRPAKKAHPAFVVDGLAGLLARAVDAGFTVAHDVPVGTYVRAFVFDPFGNRLELMEAAPQPADDTGLA